MGEHGRGGANFFDKVRYPKSPPSSSGELKYEIWGMKFTESAKKACIRYVACIFYTFLFRFLSLYIYIYIYYIHYILLHNHINITERK